MKLRAPFRIKEHKPWIAFAGESYARDMGDKTVVLESPTGIGHAELIVAAHDVPAFPVGAIVTLQIANPPETPSYAKED